MLGQEALGLGPKVSSKDCDKSYFFKPPKKGLPGEL
jgi:hypothetical protein